MRAVASTAAGAVPIVRQGINVIRLGRYPIVKQLQLEERLLRETSSNWYSSFYFNFIQLFL
jgi:hypothetical protein